MKPISRLRRSSTRIPFSSRLTVPISEKGASQYRRSLFVQAQIMLEDVNRHTCRFGSDSATSQYPDITWQKLRTNVCNVYLILKMTFVNLSEPLLPNSLPRGIRLKNSIEWQLTRLRGFSNMRYQNHGTTHYASAPSVWRIKHSRCVPYTCSGCRE